MIEIFINRGLHVINMALRVVELFAGVGGFRIGLEGPPGSSKDGEFSIVWSNQWEPSTKKQHAAEIYTERWSLEQSVENPLYYEFQKMDAYHLDIPK